MIKKVLGWIFIPYVMLGILVKRKTGKVSSGLIAGVVGFFILMGVMGAFGDETPKNNTVSVNNVSTISSTPKPTEVPKSSPTSTPIPTPIPTVTPKPTNIPTPTISPEELENQKYKKWVDDQFSAWDGSHSALVKLVKDNMNDAKSFEHVETRYNDNKDGLLIIMKYRGNNAFGAKVLNYVTAKSDYKTNTITIVPN